MLVTINTDASYSRKYNIGTFAFWIVSNEGRVKASGCFKNVLHNSSQAEMKCICNAIAMLSKTPYKNKVTRIIINTDSMNSIHLFTQNKTAVHKFKLTRKSYNKIADAYFELLMTHFPGVSIEFHHIKSHKTTNTPSTYVNQRCDDAAKEEMGKKINQLKNKNHVNKNNHNAGSVVSGKPHTATKGCS